MATARERLEELRALKAQQPAIQPVTDGASSDRQRLEELRALQQQPTQPEAAPQEEPGVLDTLSNIRDVLVSQFIDPEVETLRSFATAPVAEAAAGLTGTVASAIPGLEPGAGVGVAAGVRERLTPEPLTKKKGVIGGALEELVGLVKKVPAGLGGIADLIDSGDFGGAVETIREIEKSPSKFLGGKTLEATGSPLAATIAETAIPAALSVAGFKPTVRGVTSTAEATAAATRNIAKTTTGLLDDALKFQTPTKKRIGELLKQKTGDVETAKFKLQENITKGAPKVVRDKAAIETIKQGFDEGVIAAIKGSTPVDKVKMLKMAEIMQRGKKNKLFAQRNRPTDVVGDTLLDSFRDVKSANKTAGKQLDAVAKSLKGKAVDQAPAVNQFIDDLDGIGVKLGADLKPQFKGSDIEGVTAAERVVKQVVDRMRSTKTPDAFDLHRLKRFIDEQVSFGKAGEGLTGRTEGILKNLRRNVDGILDKQFPKYDKVNTVFSETIGAIDALQDVAGKKLNLTGRNADKATGTLLRRLMGNTQSRVRLLDAVDSIESVAKKHGPTRKGAAAKDDLLTQVLFADELDAVFGPTARTSFQGQIRQAIPTSQIDAAIKVAEKGADISRNINQDAAFKAIRKLLKESQ